MRNHGLRASWIATILATRDRGRYAAGERRHGRDRRTAPRRRSVDRPPALRPMTVEQARRDRTHADERPAPPEDRQPPGTRAATPICWSGCRASMGVRSRARTPTPPMVGTMPSGSKYYGVADHRLGRGDREPRALGTRGDPVRVAPPRRVDPAARAGAVEHPRARCTSICPSTASPCRSSATRCSGCPTATGAPVSPTPPGEYFVTDRIPFPSGGSLGTFAFGISGIQPNLPPGWSGGNQLAIHGTNDPSSIGTSASAGCMRVSEQALDRLLPLLQLGTPVIVEPLGRRSPGASLRPPRRGDQFGHQALR